MDFRKGKGREELEINLIPFIDVLLVILIFMMVTTTYSKFTSLHIQLPTEDGDRSKEQIVRIHVGVDAHGHYAINDQVVTATDSAGLEAELKRVAEEKAQKEARQKEEEKQREEERVKDAERVAEEQRRAEEARIAEAKRQEEFRLAEIARVEAERIAEQKRRDDEEKRAIAEAIRMEEEKARQQAEERLQEEVKQKRVSAANTIEHAARAHLARKILKQRKTAFYTLNKAKNAVCNFMSFFALFGGGFMFFWRRLIQMQSRLHCRWPRNRAFLAVL